MKVLFWFLAIVSIPFGFFVSIVSWFVVGLDLAGTRLGDVVNIAGMLSAVVSIVCVVLGIIKLCKGSAKKAVIFAVVPVAYSAAILGGMELHDDGLVAIAAITIDMMKSIGATQNDTEDIANLVGALEGVKASVTIRELAPGKNKISLRTDPNYLNASATCSLLGGGGHAAASGATVNADVAETKRVILDAIRKVKYGN